MPDVYIVGKKKARIAPINPTIRPMRNNFLLQESFCFLLLVDDGIVDGGDGCDDAGDGRGGWNADFWVGLSHSVRSGRQKFPLSLPLS
jgi:hypothetical protein